MDNAAVYVGTDGTQALSMEAMIYANAETALAQIAHMERHLVAQKDGAWDRSPLGLFDIVPDDIVIALGMLAHTALADCRKRSLFAGNDFAEGQARSDHDIGRLIWSCANTSRAIAVGEKAWRAVQMLPVADRRQYEVPPLKFPQPEAGVKARDLFIVNHEPDDRLSRELAALAASDGFNVTCCGLAEMAHDPAFSMKRHFWCAEAAIHVHVGLHATSTKAIRLVDSWHSGRLAVQLVPPKPQTGWEPGKLWVEDEANGFICHSAEAVLAVCRELEDDPVLGRKLISAAHHSAAPLARAWSAIAQDLLRDQ
jgi:hypothetical protein